jgi:hypothetical protein
MKSITVPLVAMVALVGCVSTQTTGVRSARFEGTQFTGVAVFVSAGNFSKRQYYEDLLVQELRSRHINAASSMKLFPPTDKFGPDEIVEIMGKFHLDTVLYITPAGESHDVVITGTQTNVNCYGNSCYANTYNTGHTSNNLALEVKLTEFTSGKTVWAAQSTAHGGGVGVFGKMGVGNDLIEHMAGDISDQIQAESIFAMKLARR